MSAGVVSLVVGVVMLGLSLGRLIAAHWRESARARWLQDRINALQKLDKPIKARHSIRDIEK